MTVDMEDSIAIVVCDTPIESLKTGLGDLVTIVLIC